MKDCCKDKRNLSRIWLDRYVSVDTCWVCGCKHRRLYALAAMQELVKVSPGGAKRREG